MHIDIEVNNMYENNNFMMKYITNAFQYTDDTTLRWFQYRISHRILATNEYLFKIKIKDSKLCTFCLFVCLFGFNVALKHLRSYHDGVCL